MSETCETCLGWIRLPHDHKPDGSGLDDGPWIAKPRKKMEAKPPEVVAEIRRRSWATRRGEHAPAKRGEGE